jgi:hypothetical protein
MWVAEFFALAFRRAQGQGRELAGATQAGALLQEFSKSAERAASANQRRLATGDLANRQREGFKQRRGISSRGEFSLVSRITGIAVDLF